MSIGGSERSGCKMSSGSHADPNVFFVNLTSPFILTVLSRICYALFSPRHYLFSRHSGDVGEVCGDVRVFSGVRLHGGGLPDHAETHGCGHLHHDLQNRQHRLTVLHLPEWVWQPQQGEWRVGALPFQVWTSDCSLAVCAHTKSSKSLLWTENRRPLQPPARQLFF